MPRFQENVPLSEHSNYKIGGPARYFFTARTEASLKSALTEAKRRKLPVFLIGGATNLLFPDKGFNGLVIKCAFGGLERRGNRIHIGAGVSMTKLIRFAAQNNLAGLEWAGGLPGTIGGAIRGNAGCFGGETKDSIVEVRGIDTRTLQVITRPRQGCRFAYRSSIYKEKQGREVVLAAVFALKKGRKDAIWRVAKKNIDWRKERHPLEYPNIGSIFKNVPVQNVPHRWQKDLAANPKMDPFPVVPAARLIARANMKGKRRGGAMISLKHTNFIVNVRKAKAADVKYLVKFVQRTIKRKFGIELEPEVQIL